MTNDFIFLSVAFGPKYIEQQTRLHQSILNHYSSGHHKCWTDAYPLASEYHHKSLYGFKVHAINVALKLGYKRIIWLDTACILQHPVDYWFNLNLPIVAAKDDNVLSKCISDKALDYYGNPDIAGMHLIGGSVYVFNFENPTCQVIFDNWAKAEADGIFGSQYEQSSGLINRHRHDEACLAYSMYSNGVEPLTCDAMRYNQGGDSIIVKRHFK